MVTVRNAESGEAWRAKARRIEALGYDTLTTPDHLTAQFAPIPAFVAAADATTTLRVSALVFANDYRNPVLLAKEIATLDVLSQGRCDIGIGTGWYAPDYEMLGIQLDPPPVRVARLREAIALMKRLWTEERVDFDGHFYRVRGAVVLPRPTQRPHPPIVIGASGPTMLRLAGAEADVISITGPLGRRDDVDTSWRAQKSENAFAARIDIVRRAAGSRFASCDVNADAEIRVTDDRDAMLAEIASKEGVSPDEVSRSPHYLVGSFAEIGQQLVERREHFGLTVYRAPEADMQALAPLVAVARTL
jgi:probable F420-dependent oxidoreductase